MRLPGSALRAVGLLAVALWIANTAWPRAESPEFVEGDTLARDLPRLTSSAAGIDARFDHVPAARERDWLAAINDAGAPVRWSGDIASLALETYGAADPAGGALVLVSAPSRASVADELGPIDTIETEGGPSLVRVGDARGTVTLASGRELARTEVPTAMNPRRILVSGSASWEGKFLIAALEEAGWQVDARLRVRPNGFVVGAGGAAADTARHAAVILLDSTANVGGLTAFVRAGGGVILVGGASSMRSVAPIVAWRVARRETAPLGTLPGDTLWRGPSRVLFGNVDTSRAIILERRAGAPVIVARRHYGGRVLAIGYDDTWRWRMAGGANSVAEHRAWWSRLVGSVALRPVSTRDVVTGSAPLAALHASLGPPVASDRVDTPFPRALLANVLGAIALAALLAEWLLRRFRGQP